LVRQFHHEILVVARLLPRLITNGISRENWSPVEELTVQVPFFRKESLENLKPPGPQI
jgi:hypothetical protein